MKTTSNSKFADFLSKFAPKEYIALSLAIIVSIPILIYGFSDKGENPPVAQGFKPITATKEVYSTNGGRPVDLFDTSFYIAYENTINDNELALIKEILNEYLVPYHILFDRHKNYFAEEVVNPKRPTLEEQNTTPLVQNLKVINDNIGSFVEVDYPLYDLIKEAQKLAIKSNGAFNPFVGELTDYWADLLEDDIYPNNLDPLVNDTKRLELERIQSFVPTSIADIENALTFNEDPVNDKYSVKLNNFHGAKKGELSLTLGGIAKGYVTDIIKEVMNENHLNRGYIFGGASSITMLSPSYFGKARLVDMESIVKDENGFSDSQPSYVFSRKDLFSMSTSGTSGGKTFTHPTTHEKYLRSHIIDPFSGYPANNPQQLVTVISNDLSGTELEILSTGLIVMSINEGQNFIKNNYANIDINIAYLTLENKQYFLYRNADFPGENVAYFHVSELYREKNLEI